MILTQLCRRRLDIPIPYVLLFYIPLPVFPIPDIPNHNLWIRLFRVCDEECVMNSVVKSVSDEETQDSPKSVRGSVIKSMW